MTYASAANALVMFGFGACAALATWAVWRDDSVRPVAYALIGSYLVSNGAHFFLEQPERPPAYSVAETMVMASAFLAYVCGGTRWLIALVIISIASVGFNLSISRYETPTLVQVNGWEVTTNVAYLLECLTVGTIGLMQRVRPSSGYRFWDRTAVFHDRPANAGEAE